MTTPPNRRDLIRLRGWTAAQWSVGNPILAAREPGIETDTGRIKYGDGVTAWNSLPYSPGGSGGSQWVDFDTGSTVGVAYGEFDDQVRALERGALVVGRLSSDTIDDAAIGSLIVGRVGALGSSNSFAAAPGGVAAGAMDASTGGSASISASGWGAFAAGYAYGYGGFASISASGYGAFAAGYTYGENISATANGSFQWGPGTNDVEQSLRVGVGPWLVGTIGAPASPQNGMIWLNEDGQVVIRSGGVDVVIA